MGKVRQSVLQKKDRTIGKPPKKIRKKSLQAKKIKKGIKHSLTSKAKSRGKPEDLDLNGNDFEDDDGELSEEDAEFIAKTRMGESFPIKSDPLEDDSHSDGEGPKMDLDHLMENDPDFYQYLMKNEKSLLEFENEEDGDDVDEDEDDDEGSVQDVKVTDKLLQSWSTQLKSKPDRALIRSVIGLFKRAVDQVSGKISDEDIEPRYKISSDHFNEIMKLCFVDLTPALYKSLGIEPPSKRIDSTNKNSQKHKKSQDVCPNKCANWKKMVGPIKLYLTSLITVLNSVANDSLTSSLLRHFLNLIPFISSYTHLVKRFLNKVTSLWSSERSEKIRILSFLFILRLMKRDDQKIIEKEQKKSKSQEDASGEKSSQLDTTLRKMYLSFAKNCRLTNVETWPFINFMKQSLIELYSLDQGICYRQTFVFLRQTAITLRNAMSNTSVDGQKTVYNWAFVHSLCLWSQLLTTLHPSSVLKPLIYPLVQVTIGTIQLSTSGQHIPVKFHLIRALIHITKETDIFIPIAHLLTDSLDVIDYSSSRSSRKIEKQKKSEARKNVDLASMIKISKGDSSDPHIREEIIKTTVTLTLEYLSSQSHRISFPELTFVTSQKVTKH